MTRRIIDPDLIRQLKDGPDKQAEVEVVRNTPQDLSIDKMLEKGLEAINRLMSLIMMDISGGQPSRETVMNLKDCITLLHTLKEKEDEILNKMSDEELQKLADS